MIPGMRFIEVHYDPKRWDLKRLAQSGSKEDRALAEQGLADWADALDREDGARMTESAKPISAMKPDTTSKSFPTNPDEVAAAIANAPERVQDPEGSYDPNDPVAVEAYWKEATVRRTGQRLT